MESQMTSANLLVVMLVALVVGALTGLALGGTANEIVLALAAGFLAAVAASVARNTVVVQWSGAGPDNSRIPFVVVVFACVASVAGSLAAVEVSDAVYQLSR
jgi:hypothetical protein